jgi:hypothetical protein
MRLIPLEVKRYMKLQEWISTDQPEVCPCEDKLPYLQHRKCSGRHCQTFNPTNYPSEVLQLRYETRLFQPKTAIEYP